MMNKFICLLQKLCGNNQQLYQSICQLLQDEISEEKTRGIRSIDIQRVGALYFDLESTEFMPALNRENLCQSLKNSSQNPRLIDQIFGRPGVEVRQSI